MNSRVYDSFPSETLRPGRGNNKNTAIINDKMNPSTPNINMSVRFSCHEYFAAAIDVYAKPIAAPVEAMSKTQPITARPIKHVRAAITVQKSPACVGTPFLLR